MKNLTFLKALAFVCSSIRDLPVLAAQSGHPLNHTVHWEMAHGKKDVQRALREGHILSAAHSAYASSALRQAVRSALEPALSELLSELGAQWESVLSGDREARAVFSAERTRHLPRHVQVTGCLNPEETRQLICALLSEGLMVAVWAQVQQADHATKEGLLKYAASNSTFMDRAALFGPRVNVSLVPGEYHYVFWSDLILPLMARVSEEEMDWSGSLTAPSEEEKLDLEGELFAAACGYSSLVGQHRPLFGQLYDLLREKPEHAETIRRGHRHKVSSKAQLRSLGQQYKLKLSEVEVVAAALMEALRNMRSAPGIIFAEGGTGESTQSPVSSFIRLRKIVWMPKLFFRAGREEEAGLGDADLPSCGAEHVRALSPDVRSKAQFLTVCCPPRSRGRLPRSIAHRESQLDSSRVNGVSRRVNAGSAP